MTEFKQLVKDGKVSKCGRWLIDPYMEWFLLCSSGAVSQQWLGKEMPETKHGLAFYSRAHGELAQDTREAEQICRKSKINISDFWGELGQFDEDDIKTAFLEYKKVPEEEQDDAFVMFSDLDERFGEKRLIEILNQELSE